MNELVLVWGGLLLLAIGCVVLYVWTLVNAARNSQWVWFVLILLIWPFCLAYLLFAKKRPSGGRTPIPSRVEPY